MTFLVCHSSCLEMCSGCEMDKPTLKSGKEIEFCSSSEEVLQSF